MNILGLLLKHGNNGFFYHRSRVTEDLCIFREACKIILPQFLGPNSFGPRVFRSSKHGETSLALGVSHLQSGEERERDAHVARLGKDEESGSETKDPDGRERTGEERRTQRPSSWSSVVV